MFAVLKYKLTRTHALSLAVSSTTRLALALSSDDTLVLEPRTVEPSTSWLLNNFGAVSRSPGPRQSCPLVISVECVLRRNVVLDLRKKKRAPAVIAFGRKQKHRKDAHGMTQDGVHASYAILGSRARHFCAILCFHKLRTI